MTIDQFRAFINDFQSGFVHHHYLVTNERNGWSCICSAMDWLTEAVDALPEFQKRARGRGARWIDLYGLISCIDVTMDATEQLHRCVFQRGGKPAEFPFPAKGIFSKPTGFESLSDRKFFKELRAGFGAHPVNMEDSENTVSPKERARRFASWVLSSERFQMLGDFDFSVRLYSSVKGVEDIHLGVKVSELEEFCKLFHAHLEAIVAEIKRQYRAFAAKCRKDPIERRPDSVAQWEVLQREAKRRCLGHWDADVETIFKASPKHPCNRELLAAYRDAIRPVIDRMVIAFEKMALRRLETVREDFHRVLYPPYPDRNGLPYALGKLLTGELPYSCLQVEIEEFFGSQIDFGSIASDVERRALVRAALHRLASGNPQDHVSARAHQAADTAPVGITLERHLVPREPR